MSNRTIIELNHDWAAKIASDPAEAGAALAAALTRNDQPGWDALRQFGMTRIVTAHHTDERNVYVNGRKVEAP